MIEPFDAAWDDLTGAGARFAMTEIEVRANPMRVVRQRAAADAIAVGPGRFAGAAAASRNGKFGTRRAA